MLQFMQQYGVFVALAIGAVLWSWLAVAYGRAFWFSRRFSHLQQTLVSLALLTFAVVLPFATDVPFAAFFQFYCALLITPIVMLWRRWYGVVVEPGYASARELLRLRRPLVDPPVRNAAAGLFVPLNDQPRHQPAVQLAGAAGRSRHSWQYRCGDVDTFAAGSGVFELREI